MNTKGVNFQPSERGQFSTAVDTRHEIQVKSRDATPEVSSRAPDDE
jgi:hypothetical protein